MSRDLPVLVGIELPSGCHLCPLPETLALRGGEALFWLLCFWFHWKFLPPSSFFFGGGEEKREREVGRGREK